jgi:hypothetical protein
MMKRTRRSKRGRIAAIVASLFLIALGTATVLEGNLEWRNYWGGLVFAPVAILFGLLLLYAAIFRWDKMNKPPGDKKGRIPEVFRDSWRKW